MLAVHNAIHAPPTPPYTSTFLSRTTTTLPPITHFDRHLSPIQPLTPPEEPHDVDMLPDKPTLPSDASHLVDWLDFTRSRSAHFIAEKTCEMICYLWHAKRPTPPNAHISTLSGAHAYPSPSSSPPSSALTHTSHPAPSTTTSHQLIVTPAFVSFVQKMLETTQVSQSVIVLSLHYIYKIKENTGISGPPGSEFRVAVAGLMMANKFLDDNTYTNKTWSEVSGIELKEVNNMEKEFLVGVRYNLYVDKATYEAWLNLLKGLVMVKERDMLRARDQQKRRRRPLGRPMGHAQVQTPCGRTRYYKTAGNGACVLPGSTTSQAQPASRARSTSPIFRHSLPSQTHLQPVFRQLPPIQTQPPPRSSPSYLSQPQPQTSYNYKPTSYTYSPSPTPSSLKRSAATAFSPTSASFSQVPTKRSGVSAADTLPPIATSTVSSTAEHVPHQRPGITLQIPHDQRPVPHSTSPMDNLPLQGFAKMNLGSTGSIPPPSYVSTSSSLSSALGPMPGELEREREAEERRRQTKMTTLVQPYHYSMDDQQRNGIPKNLYFYTLACSPLDDVPNVSSRAPSPIYSQQEDYEMEREAALERERELELERESELEKRLELEAAQDREREGERERQRKARLRVHRPAPASSIRYSDYASMPYVPSTGITGYSMSSSHQSYVPSSTGVLPTNAAIIGHTQSARTSPATGNVGRHFDAVRFEVERTQRYVPPSDLYQQPPRHASTQTQPQSQNHYNHPESILPSVPPQPTRKPQGQNPYPQLSPPTPATSTSTSPVAFTPARNAYCATRVDRGSPYSGYGNRGHGNSPYSSLAGANTYSYERSCISAYTSPAIDSRKYSPANHGNGMMSSLPPPAYHYPSGPTVSAAREELAFAQAQAQHQKTAPQYYDSPGVPAAPFANAGPPGVQQMQYYSVPTPPGINATGRGGYAYPGINTYPNGCGPGYGR